MLYSEFIENVKCRDNEYNYKVYKTLENLYMINDKLTKTDIYETAKTLVNNDKSQKQVEFENDINARINVYNKDIKYFTDRIDMLKSFFEISTDEQNKIYREDIKRYKTEIKKCKIEIKKLKWVLGL